MSYKKIFIINFICLLWNRLWQVCEHKLLNILLLVSLAIFAFSLPVCKLAFLDFWHHLKTGEIILQNKDIPKKDIFSFTCEGKEWIDNEWLYQVLVYSLYSFGSFVFGPDSEKSTFFLIIWQGALSSLLAFIMITMLLQRAISLPIAAFCTLIVLILLQDRFIFRSELYSLLFTVFYLWIFYRFKQKNTNVIFLLPFLQWIWLSMHGGFVMGFFITALFLVSELIAKAVYSQKSGVRSQESRVRCSVFEIQNSKLETQIPHSAFRIPKLTYSFAKFLSLLHNLQFAIRNYIAPPISNSQLKKLALVFFLTLVLPLLNPFFYKAYLLPFQVQFGEEFKIMRDYLMEWLPLDITAPGKLHIFLFTSVAILSLAGFVLQEEKRNIFYYLLFFSVLPMPYVNIRHLGIFAVCSILPFALGIQSTSQRLASLFKKDWVVKRVFLLLSIIVILYSLWFIQARVRHPAFGVGVQKLGLPVKACEFLKQAEIKGPIFNILAWGGYILWRLYPKYKTFVDGRNVMLGNRMVEKYFTIESVQPGWEKTLSQYNVNFIITTLFQIIWSPSPEYFLSALDTSPNWSLIYFDDVSAIYLHKTPANLNLIEKYGYKGVKLSDQSLSYIKNAFSLDVAIADFKRKVSEDPSCAIAHTFLAMLLGEKGELAKAELEYRMACEYTDNDVNTLINLAGFYLCYGRADDALAEALKAYKKAPKLAVVNSFLGECYLAKNEIEKARNYFHKTLKLSPDNPSYVLTNIGLCYAQEGNLEKAKEKFISALRLNSSYLPARLNLAKYYKKQLNLDGAELELRECLKILPNSAESFYNLASIKVLQGNQKEAIKLLRESIKLGGEKFAEQAGEDPDFVSLRENKKFYLPR